MNNDSLKDILNNVFDGLCKYHLEILTKALKDERELSGTELKELREFLKQNDISAIPTAGNALGQLGKEATGLKLPDIDDDVDPSFMN